MKKVNKEKFITGELSKLHDSLADFVNNTHPVTIEILSRAIEKIENVSEEECIEDILEEVVFTHISKLEIIAIGLVDALLNPVFAKRLAHFICSETIKLSVKEGEDVSESDINLMLDMMNSLKKNDIN
ncbi:MAG: hypothetical protein H8E55_08940 [Pelagibacterales bacterium]|nr:hypothetical protein [Pelagibacterales bacterium]